MNIRRITQTMKKRTIDLLCPPVCALCGEVLAPSRRYICRQCEPLIEYPAPPVCLKCGCETGGEDEELCADCTRQPRTYIRGFPAMKYRYPLNESLAGFKYHNRREYAGFYAQEIVKRHGRMLTSLDIEALIPVPVHKSRLRTRGYNQAELLAREISRRLAIPVETELLVRSADTKPQKTLNPGQREKNLREAFCCTGKHENYRQVALVDDIYTTGATVEACTVCLHEAGIQDIYYTSVAIGGM